LRLKELRLRELRLRELLPRVVLPLTQPPRPPAPTPNNNFSKHCLSPYRIDLRLWEVLEGPKPSREKELLPEKKQLPEVPKPKPPLVKLELRRPPPRPLPRERRLLPRPLSLARLPRARLQHQLQPPSAPARALSPLPLPSV
jgi:hypothetical protein